LRTTFAVSRLGHHRLLAGALTVRPAPSFRLDRAAGPNWFAVGDAASAYDPISSQGIYKALSDGIRAGDSIAASLASGRDLSETYDSSIRLEFETYLTNRNFFYGLEQRWPKSHFWKRRRERASCVQANVSGLTSSFGW
jgi:flavin-dependent dehydrogenase